MGSCVLCVCGSVTMITRNCVHRSSLNWFLGKGSDHLQLIKFWPPCAPGKESAAGRIFLAPAYYSSVCVSSGRFFICKEVKTKVILRHFQPMLCSVYCFIILFICIALFCTSIL